MKKKEKNNALPMSLTKRIVLAILAIAAVVAIIYFSYYIIHYRLYYGYKDFIEEEVYEEGTVYTPLTDSDKKVSGMDLVAENDTLKLYTDTKTGYVAVYDKRNGNTVYSNPLNADDDEIANATNKNYLKSAMIISYYNSDVVSGNYDSYSGSVQKGNFTVESIENGVRYIYTIGDVGDESIYFKVPLEWRLSGDGVEATVPAGQIEEFNGSLYRIQLLRYFGAADDRAEGYMVVPNGSGSIIYYNNGKTSEAAYSQYIYDLDPLVANYTTTENTVSAKLPLFGMCNTDNSVLATVESGASIANITASISGTYSQYNYAYATFTVRNADNLRMFGDSSQDVYVLEKQPYSIDCTVRFTLLTDENAGYAGIANYYRNRLIAEGKLTENGESGDIPFYYDVISGVQETSHFLGVQYLHTFAMTTFEEAEELSNSLKEDGITNQVMNLQGWFNDGYYHDVADKIKVESSAGSKKDLSRLNETLSENGGRLYADVAFQKVSFVADGYNYSTESSRYYSGYTVSFGVVNPTTLRNTANLGYSERRYNLLSPRYLPRYVEKFANKITKIDVDGISLRDLGNVLASDKRRTLIIDRDEALQIVEGQLGVIEDTGKNVMTNEANAYAFAYSDDIINAPITGNDYRIVDEDIPLYAMIIHGCIDYSSTLLNFDDSDMTDTVLQMIENGASPHYVFTKEESSEMKDTGLNDYYSTTFDVWEEEAADIYSRVNDALKYVTGATITNHEILDSGLRRVTYSNGVVIYVNYTDSDITEDGITVPTKSYEVEGE